MNYNFSITTSDHFVRSLKELAKKYPSIKQDMEQLKAILLKNPTEGISLGKNCYKIRLKIGSKNTGKKCY